MKNNVIIKKLRGIGEKILDKLTKREYNITINC